MAIILNDNIKINAGKPSESKYLNSNNAPYVSVADVISAIPIATRYIGLTVLIESGSTNVEYWWKTGVENDKLIEKKYTSEQLVGDFITGATNLGYFSGTTGIQRLAIAGTGFGSDIGDYFSEYQWYYVDSDGDIRIGSPTYDTPLRRGYVNANRTKSWVWSVPTNGWEISLNDIVANVGQPAIISPHTDYVFTNTEWVNLSSYGVASANLTAYGILNSGTTEVTFGNPIYNNKSNQELHLRTIINETPEFLKIESDDNYIRFSGVSSVISGNNYGGGIGVFSGQTGTELKFKTLVPSGDTSITQTADGKLIIYSSTDGSANALTGATSIGSGVAIFSGTTDRNMHFRSIIGTGTTVVTTNGDSIVVDSTGILDQFTSDITVSIASGKTFGKYLNGDIIPASGKTANEVILMSLAESLEPTLQLSSSATNVLFGESGKTVNVTFSHIINTLGASVSTAVLEWRRGNTGAWSGLTSDTGETNYFHIIDDSDDRFNTAVINYRYTVVDSAGGSGQTTYNVTPQAYLAPTISPNYNSFNLESYETETLREAGNIITTITGNIASNRPLVNLLTYRVQRNDGSGYITVASATTINNLTRVITSYQDNSANSSATSISYRIVVDDEYQSGIISSIYTINFRYASYFGYNTSTVLSSGQIIGLGNEALLTSRVRTIGSATAPANNYTYVSYPASYGDLTSVIMDGASPVLGAFTKLSNVSVTNFYGETVSNIIYKSQAPAAFTNNELAFS